MHVGAAVYTRAWCALVLVWMVQTGPAASLPPGACIVLSCRPHWGLYRIVMPYSLHTDHCRIPSHVGYIGGIEWTGHCKLLHLGMFAIACLTVSNMLLLRLLKGCSLEIFCGRNGKSSTARLYGRESRRIIGCGAWWHMVVHGTSLVMVHLFAHHQFS